MKKSGILNPDLCYGLAKLGHGQGVFIVDAGMPLPPVPSQSPRVVDLALRFGIPRFTDVLDAVLAEIIVQDCAMANEGVGTIVETWLTDRGLSPSHVSHDHLKKLLPDSALIIRTGEATPYANVRLICGVPF